ncbi:MAG: iron-containing alcohol dehydrogenase [Pseudomonadota bacterium]
MDRSFAFSVPTNVQFGWGASQAVVSALPPETKSVALLRGKQAQGAHSIRQALDRYAVSRVEVICSGEPSFASVNAAVNQLGQHKIEAVIAVGGGSVIDAGKVVAFCLGRRLALGSDFSEVPTALLSKAAPIPSIAIPTTAGTGAEVTANAVLDIPERQAKVSLRGRALFPSAALVDPDLLKSAPDSVLLYSGLDAVVQTIEAYTSCAATPFSDALTEPNITLGIKALQQIMAGNAPDRAWQDMAWVSLTSGMALANGGLGAAHGIASILGGRYAAPHGALCGRLLAPVLRKNLEVAADGTMAAKRLSACLSHIHAGFGKVPHGDDLSGLEDWQERHVLPRLRTLGVQQEDIQSIAEASATASSSKKNAVALTPHDFADILRRAL